MWQPIETAPRDGTLLILWGRYWSDDQGWMRRAMMGQWIESRQRWEVYFITPFGIKPTHWMPIPEPPK